MSDVAAEARREAQVERPGEVWVAETELRAGSIGLTGAVMQNITHPRRWPFSDE